MSTSAQQKLRSLSLKKANKNVKASTAGYSATIKRLKNDLEMSTQQIAALQQEVEKMRGENQTLAMTVNQKDSLLTKAAKQYA